MWRALSFLLNMSQIDVNTVNALVVRMDRTFTFFSFHTNYFKSTHHNVIKLDKQRRKFYKLHFKLYLVNLNCQIFFKSLILDAWLGQKRFSCFRFFEVISLIRQRMFTIFHILIGNFTLYVLEECFH